MSDRDGYLWVMVGYGQVAWPVCVSSFGEELVQWVLLSRADRDRRAERSGLVLLIVESRENLTNND